MALAVELIDHLTTPIIAVIEAHKFGAAVIKQIRAGEERTQWLRLPV